MRNDLVTPFWKNALHSLPANLQPRYASYMAAAERWELRIDALVELFSRLTARPARGPRAA